MTKVYNGAMISIMALFPFGVILPLGGVTPDLLSLGYAFGALLILLWCAWLVFSPSATWKRSPTHLPVALFVAYAFVRYWTAPVEYEARVELMNVSFYAGLYFIAANQFRTSAHRTTMLVVVAVLAMLEASYGIYQAVSGSNDVLIWTRPESYSGRASGSFVCPNHLAGFLEIALGLIAARLFWVRPELITIERKILRIIGWSYAGLMALAGIAFTHSRGGWVATAVAMVFFAIIGSRLASRAFVRVTVVAAVVVAAVLLALSTDAGWRRFSSTFKREGKQEKLQVADATLGGRSIMWKGTVAMIRERPLAGVGPGNWQWLFQPHKKPPLILNPEFTHNDYLNLLADYGFIGFALAAWFFFAFFRQVRSIAPPERSPEERAFALGAAVSVVAILAHSMSDFNLHIAGNAAFLALIMGMTAGLDDGSSRYPARTLNHGRWAVAALLLVLSGVLAWRLVPTVRGAFYTEIGKEMRRTLEYDTAFDAFAVAAEADPKSPQVQLNLGELFLIQASMRTSPDKAESRKESCAAAAEAFDRAIELNPYLVAAWIGRGRAYEFSGEPMKAIENYQKATLVDTANVSAFFRLGCVYRDQGKESEATKAFEKSQWLRSYGDSSAELNLLDYRFR